MKNKNFIETLEGIGLPKKAAEMYLAILGNKRMNIMEISKVSGVKRATCYEYINSLLQKNFLIQVPIGKRMYYSAVDPQKVLNDFKKKSNIFTESLELLTKSYEQTGPKPKISFYEGKPAIKNVYEEFFQTIGDAYSIFPPESFFENFSEKEYSDFDKKVTDNAFKARDLFVVDKYYKKIQAIRKKNVSKGKTDKKLPEWFRTNVDVLIYNNKVALISLRDLSAVVIENKDIAELFKNMHNFMWRAL